MNALLGIASLILILILAALGVAIFAVAVQYFYGVIVSLFEPRG